LSALTRPLRSLTTAMEQFGRGETVRLAETGSKELVATARAVNDMQERIQCYLDDRQRLFASISHDLKTPITRLRLRAELLQKEEVRNAFCEDLEDLEIMVKASLQCVKDTDIHENPTNVDIGRLLYTLQEGAGLSGNELLLPDQLVCYYRGKPLALKRCIGNLIDNAIYYGQRAVVSVEDGRETLILQIRDFGPGIPADKIDRAFEPYTRLSPHKSLKPGHGLGLSIARNIARAHGGEVMLSNHPDGGLVVRLLLPR
jgi:signal transduction histidine kinase